MFVPGGNGKASDFSLVENEWFLIAFRNVSFKVHRPLQQTTAWYPISEQEVVAPFLYLHGFLFL